MCHKLTLLCSCRLADDLPKPPRGRAAHKKFAQQQRGKSLGAARQASILADPTLAKNVGELAARKRVYARADDEKRNRLRSHSDSVSMDAYHRLSEDNDRLREELRKQKANSAILHTARKHAEESLSTVPSFLSRLSNKQPAATTDE
jgi:hypothetical protein